jgi:hypothetical protein
MHADDGVKGYFIGDWKRLVLSAYQPTDMLAMGSQILYYFDQVFTGCDA